MRDNAGIAFGTVIYQEAENYLKDFFDSVAAQTYSNFTLLILNENISKERCKVLLRDYEDYHSCAEILDCPKEESIVGHRIRLMREAKKRHYRLLIIGDCDDVFSKERVKAVTDLYESNRDVAFFYNDITDFFGKKMMPPLPDVTSSIDHILELNYLGMSNTAINLSVITDDFLESLSDFKGNVFDWYLFSRIILNGGMGKYVFDGGTGYRLHDANIVGIREDNDKNIAYELMVKRNHYHLLSKYSPKYEQLSVKYDNINTDNLSKKKTKQGLHYWWDLIRLEDTDENV